MIAFVILHYKNINDTLECLESIEKLNLSNYKVIIVENGSLDDSTKILESMQDKVDIVFNHENYGFAKGNNSGISYAKEKYKPNFYIVINNDILVCQKNIIDEIEKLDKKYQFDVLGPKIISRNGINQNPNYFVLTTTKSIIKHIFRLKIISLFISMGIYEKIKNIGNKTNRKISNIANETIQTDAPLHGSALIFSERYINKYKEAFEELTFLYGEEEFLYYRKIRDGLNFVYTPTILVHHKEDASLNEIFQNNSVKKMKFVVKHSTKSLQRLLIKKIKDKLGGRVNE